MVCLSFTAAHGGAPSLSSVDGQVVGLQEATTYRIDVQDGDAVRLIIDDVELRTDASGGYMWAADFYAGEVRALVVDSTGQEQHFRLDVCPNPAKLGGEQYAAMLDDIRAFDGGLLLGPSAATLGFGRQGRPSRWEALIQLERLRRYGPAFLSAVAQLAREPHQFLCATERLVHLRHLRRFHPSTLLDRRLAALANGGASDTADLQMLQLRSSTAAPTVDTAANRALKALLQRFLAAVLSLADIVERKVLGGESETQERRRDRRLEVLRSLSRVAIELLRASPFADIVGAETSAAGLTQIAAHPRYARAYRLGTHALRVAADGWEQDDQLPVTPSWGVYETWCFIMVVQLMNQLVAAPLSAARSTQASADLALAGHLPDGRLVEVLFQAVFPSERPFAQSSTWSISRERRPDIMLVVTDGGTRRWMVLDAKYRSGRDNTLQAMESAHIYRDSLRLGNAPPDRALLLLPGPAAVPSLETQVFWDEHRVGALSEVAMGRPGLNRFENFMTAWLDAKEAGPHPTRTSIGSRTDGERPK
jgi:hypothetical protein